MICIVVERAVDNVYKLLSTIIDKLYAVNKWQKHDKTSFIMRLYIVHSIPSLLEHPLYFDINQA